VFRVHTKGASFVNEQSGSGMTDRLRCFEILKESFPHGPDRDRVIEARNRALETMAKKFFARVSEKKAVTSKGNTKKLAAFCMRHPFLMSRAALKALS
jgi:hypothetical protein